MTGDGLADLQSRLYEAYATQHAGSGGDEAAALDYQRDIRPLLPPSAAGPVVDPGRGRGEVVRLLQADGRIPNAVSPLGRHTRNGDFTHQTSSTARSTHKLTAADGFESVLSRSSPPVAHGLASAARAAACLVISACYRIAQAAETGRLSGHIVTHNLTFAARKDVKLVSPTEKNPA